MKEPDDEASACDDGATEGELATFRLEDRWDGWGGQMDGKGPWWPGWESSKSVDASNTVR